MNELVAARKVTSALRPRFPLNNAANAVTASRREAQTDALSSRLWVLGGYGGRATNRDGDVHVHGRR